MFWRTHAPYVLGFGPPANRYPAALSEPGAAVTAETRICQAALFRWRRQALIDAGVVAIFGGDLAEP